jgi:hypothetical protein
MDTMGTAPASEVMQHYDPYPVEREVKTLRTQAEHLEGTLKEIKTRIAKLEAAREQTD